MFQFPKDFCDVEECGLPAFWCDKGELHHYFYIGVGNGLLEVETLKGAVYYACEVIEEHKQNEFGYLPIIIMEYSCDEGFCEPVDTVISANTEEEFYEWIHKTFNI